MFDDLAFTTSASPESVKPLTIESLMETVRYLDRHYPAPPPPDPKHCANCGEEMSKPAMDVVANANSPLAAPVAYLCGRCACVAKRQFHYQRRNDVLQTVTQK
jgi:hypothetical protein